MLSIKNIFLKRKSKSCLIIDSALWGMVGHHYNSASYHSKNSKAPTTILCHKAAQNLNLNGQTIPCFSHDTYSRKKWDFDEFEQKALKMANEMLDAISDWREFSSILVPSCDQVQLLALATAIKKTKSLNKNLKITLSFLYPPRIGSTELDGNEVQKQEYLFAFKELNKSLSKSQITILTETDTLVGIYENLLNTTLHFQYTPNSISLRSRQNIKPNTNFHIVMMGHGNEHKGYSLLPDVIKNHISNNSKITFTIHGSLLKDDSPDIFNELLTLGSQARVMTETLDETEYHELICSADLLLFPYTSDRYNLTGSGVFIESEFLGIPKVVSNKCSFANQAVKEGRAIRFENLNSEDLSKSISLAMNNITSLRAACMLEKEKLQVGQKQNY